MKRYMTMLAVIFFAHCGSCLFAASYKDMTAYGVVINSSGDDAIVNAIKQYSDITQADENRWSFSWVPVVGSSIRDEMITKVRDYIRVYRGFLNLLRVQPQIYTDMQICRVLDNLSQQGAHALALLGRFGTVGDKALYNPDLLGIIRSIKNSRDNRSRICDNIKQQKAHQEQEELQRSRNKLEYNKNWWKLQQLRWKIAKGMGTTAFNGAKWVIQTANEYKGTLASGAITLFVYDKLFGIKR